MCILFLLIGDEFTPTIIANNRDEYLSRKSKRGSCSKASNLDHILYSPIDLEAGGSWLSIDINASHKRFAVVLNYHQWRDSFGNNVNRSDYLSRGKLVNDFTNDQNRISAMSYVNKIANIVTEYRPFNLIVGDTEGVYYLSSCLEFPNPIELQRGCLYGITNGHISREWEKVSIGRRRLNNEILPPFLEEFKNLVTLNQKNDLIEQCMKDLAYQLLEFLGDYTLLPDPTFGFTSQAACQLSSIFVKPTIVLKDRISSSKESILESFRVISDDKGVVDNINIIFGTRTSTVVTFSNNSNCHQPIAIILEKDLDVANNRWDVHQFVIDCNNKITETFL